MTTVKKIILFLFGIVLIVFGNKAAIDTIFKNNDEAKMPDLAEKEVAGKQPVITEEIETKEAEVITGDNTVFSPKKTEVKTEDVAKTEAPKKTTEKVAKEQTAKSSEKKEESKVKEASKTNIEPVKEETAAASE